MDRWGEHVLQRERGRHELHVVAEAGAGLHLQELGDRGGVDTIPLPHERDGALAPPVAARSLPSVRDEAGRQAEGTGGVAQEQALQQNGDVVDAAQVGRPPQELRGREREALGQCLPRCGEFQGRLPRGDHARRDQLRVVAAPKPNGIRGPLGPGLGRDEVARGRGEQLLAQELSAASVPEHEDRVPPSSRRLQGRGLERGNVLGCTPAIPDAGRARVGQEPREADQRLGYFTTTYRDLGKFKDDEKIVRYINRWNLEKVQERFPDVRFAATREHS